MLTAFTAKPLPRILLVNTKIGETRADAYDRLKAEHVGSDLRRHPMLVIPMKCRTDADRARYAVRFREQQLRIVREARSRRTADGDAVPAVNPLAALASLPKAQAKREQPWRPDARR